MPPTTAGPPIPPLPSNSSSQALLDLIIQIVSLLLLSSLNVRSFVGRWQVLHSKLSTLHSALVEILDSPYWSENPLVQTILPSLLSTLQRLKSLSDQCSDSAFSGGKLHMQSDLDMVSASLSSQLNDLDLLLRSGVLYQSNALVLSQPVPGSNNDDTEFFIRDLFTRLQIGGMEFKKKALESLVQLLNQDEKSARLVAKEGNVGYLIHLLDFNAHPSVREIAASAVSVLSTASDESRRRVFEEGGLGPLLRILETGSIHLKEKAAAAVEAITVDPENAWAVSAYGGVPVLIEACRSGTPPLQASAVGAIRNVTAVEDIKTSLVEEGAIPVLLQFLISSTTATQEKASMSIAVLAASGEYFRSLIIQELGLQKLLHLIHDSPSSDTIANALRALISLAVSDSVARILSSSTLFVMKLGELVKHGNLVLQQIAASLIANLSISDGNKRAIGSCMGSLVKLMEMPKPAGVQEVAVGALASLLTVRSNRKELMKDEKSVMRLMQMLDPKNEVVNKTFPLAIITAVLAGGSNGCRKRLIDAGAYQHLQNLTNKDIAGAKKTLQRLNGNRLRSIFSRTWRE
ncbi:armadillo repeat-containing protein 3-like [Cucurbita pepo subsp. pepo]|uniref:armadillo repeat-containing protein 3-like n=1 Tax=Cucurbita pepo subsp. pepo TaxID=3664 RepID=UPI000C9D5857|nr:armadillo repeat-containing protein 3-like [Cucurbita pepo subsp. pepo]